MYMLVYFYYISLVSVLYLLYLPLKVNNYKVFHIPHNVS